MSNNTTSHVGSVEVDKRTRLLDLLSRYQPQDSCDRETRDRFVYFIEQHEDCFSRDLLIGHVTGSSWLLDPSKSRVLFTHHRKLGQWLQLGGHADGVSDLLNVALNEAREESGIPDIVALSSEIFDLDIHNIPSRGEVPEHLHYDVRFVLLASNSDQFVVGAESKDLAWCDFESIVAPKFDPSILRMKEKWVTLTEKTC